LKELDNDMNSNKYHGQFTNLIQEHQNVEKEARRNKNKRAKNELVKEITCYQTLASCASIAIFRILIAYQTYTESRANKTAFEMCHAYINRAYSEICYR
jgi:predicted RNA-binding protein with PIN domain